MLSIARVAGETAPLLLTTFLSQSMNPNLFTGAQASVPDVHLGSDLVGYARLDRPGLGRCARPDHRRRHVLRPGPARGQTHRPRAAIDPGRNRNGQAHRYQDLDIYYGDFKAVEGVNIAIEPKSVTAFIGPSGCGKSTELRSINRMHEVIPGAYTDGEILLEGDNIYAPMWIR